MTTRNLFLVCNAHLDPVWLWQWEEGLAETLSTFRAAAQFCEEFDNFAFCHNESVLYQWIETYDPALFKKIRALVKQGRWHIMGGWYLQPDCNVPSGESFVRQALVGKRFFIEKFGAEPKTAVNLDPFGHTRGLVQILKKSGYTSYLFCRPDAKFVDLPGDDFIWVGYDGSEILAHRAPDHYNSERGKAAGKIKQWISNNRGRKVGILLWGIGNHGGGPSREDLNQIEQLKADKTSWSIQHGCPEDYFEELEKQKDSLGRLPRDLNPWAVGCYTTMALVKQKHRLLENTYFATEKMITNAALQGLLEYPRQELQSALEDLLFCEFHDILPGSSISEVEAYALQRMDHGMEILSRLRAKAFFALLSGEKPAGEGEYPFYIYNPHPFDVEETIVCEFQPPEPNFNNQIFLQPELRDIDGNSVSYQLEKESCNIQVDQRKRLVFRAGLKASAMNRFSCYLKEVERKVDKKRDQTKDFKFISDSCEVEINAETGFIDIYRVHGVDYINPRCFQTLVVKDYPDPWGMKVRAFRDVEGSFSLMSEEEGARFAGISHGQLKRVRIIESGPIRTVVEALFTYNNSSLCMRYKVPSNGSEIEIEVRVYWMEKDRMLKLSIPSVFEGGCCKGQVAYGVENFDRHGEELVAQKWIGIASSDGKNALTVINDGTHGFDFKDGELRISLLRSAAYAGHPVADDIPIVHQDRFEPRIDQGERVFRFWMNAGNAEERFSRIAREALVKNETLMVLCCFPAGVGNKLLTGVSISDDVIQITALKMAESKDWLIIRLFEPTGQDRETRVSVPFMDLEFDVSLRGFEIKTMAVDLRTKAAFEVDLLERKLD